MVRKIVLSLIVVLGVALSALAQNRQVSGVVVDESGNPIIGASATVVDTNIGATSDLDGKFAFTAPVSGTIEVSFIGYATQQVAIGGKDQFRFVMVEDATQLDDVVVVAFGTAKKEAFTGSAKVVESEDIAKVQTSNVANALVGRVAGVQTSSASGSLGSAPSIRIRGFGSINATQGPLWVVDGVPYSGDLNNLNTADIESMTVLKDAASNALYGSRGANGVVMVTTKKAKRGEAVITVDAKMGINSKALQNYNVISDPGEYYEAHYKALYNDALDRFGNAAMAHQSAASSLTGNSGGGLSYNVYTVPNGEYLIGSNGQLNPNATLGSQITGADGNEYMLMPDNWMDEAYQSSIRQEYNVTISASDERSSFYASVGYLDNDGIIDGESMERLTARLKADYQAKKWLKVGGNMSYTNFTYTGGNSEEGASNSSVNIFAFSSSIAPIYPVYVRDANGNIVQDAQGWNVYDYGDSAYYGLDASANPILSRPYLPQANALQASWLDQNISNGNAFSASGYADFQILSNLKFTVNASTTIDETRSQSLNNQYYGQYASMGGIIGVSHSRASDFNTQQLLNYNKSFGDHSFDLMVGHEYNLSTSVMLSGAKTNLFSYDNLELAGAVVDAKSAGSSYGDYNTEGYFARLQYEKDSKYYASASFRRDASSNFHPDNRWGNFWSVGGAWIASKEDFMASTSHWLDMLKVKASYGSQGNDGIGALRYTDTFTLENNDGQISVVFNTKGNKDITWETNGNFNAGIEFGTYQGRFGGSIDAFSRTTSDMLFKFSVPSSMGYSYYYDNVGDMRNYGVEGEFFGDIYRGENILWSASLNATVVKNKVTYLADENKTNTVEGYTGYISGNKFVAEGLPLYTYYMREYAGVDQATGKALFYKDLKDEDGNVTGRETTTDYSSADRYLLGTAMPSIYGGFSTSVQAYGFDASIAFTYQIGGQVYDSGYQSFMTSPTASSKGTNYHKDILESWSPTNTDSNIPRFQYGDDTMSQQSSLYLVDASYLNISNINVGYTVPQKFTKPYGVNSFRVYLACDNVAYWSKRQGLDPRYSFSGATNYANYSPIRTISGGINVVF